MKLEQQFLRWCVQGAIEYYKQGKYITKPKCLNEKTLEFIKSTEVFKRFLNERYKASTNKNKISLEQIIEDYKNSGLYQLRGRINIKQLSRLLQGLNYKIANRKYNYINSFDERRKGVGPCLMGHIRKLNILEDTVEEEKKRTKKRKLVDHFNTIISSKQTILNDDSDSSDSSDSSDEEEEGK